MGDYEVRQENNKRLPALAAEIVAGLGAATWRVDTVMDHLVTLKRNDGLHIMMSIAWDKPTMVRFAGTFERVEGVETYGLETHEASVTVTRGAAAMVSAITKRLLPAHEVQHKAFVERCEAAAEQRTVFERVTAELAELFGQQSHNGGRRADEASFYLDAARVDVSMGDYIRVEHLTGRYDTLKPVLAALATIKKGN